MAQAINNSIPTPNANPNHVIRFGMSVIFIVFGLFFGWMALAPLATSIVGVGQVSADSNKKTVQHLEGGIIKEILVKDGDLVQKDQPLIIIDSTQIESSLKTLNNQYLEAIATNARLKAQENKSLHIDFPKEILEKKDELAMIKIINGQKNILDSKITSLKEEELITAKKIDQFTNQIDGLNATISSNTQRIESIQKDIDDQEDLYKDKLVDIQRLRELRRENIRLNGEILTSKSEINRLNAQIDEAKSTQRLRNKEFYNDIANSLVDNRINTVDLQSKIESLKDTQERITIKSPSDGYVTGLQIHTVGGVISPSKPILDIVPKDSEMILITQINTPDIDKMRVGLLADTRFSAFNVQQTQVVESKVINVSADTFINEQTGASYYEVKLILTEKGKKQLKENKFFLLPGMPVEIMIKTGKRTTLSYLVKPFVDMVSRSFNEE